MTASNADILRELSTVSEAVRQLREDFRDERDAARENRARIHSRLDQQIRDLGLVEDKVIIVGQTVGQQRDFIDRLERKVAANHEEVKPSIEEWKRVKTLGWGFSGLLVALGFTGASILYWAGDAAVTFARKWLRID
ncbi:Hypothetical protein NGAL_HAMBI2605_59020 [Neorhizobium galegae bv. orientalis]|nr:Hypothetical protein NGAL_HAMBI2605_59020 [Neorhizobium galegae bv. orientalis]